MKDFPEVVQLSLGFGTTHLSLAHTSPCGRPAKGLCTLESSFLVGTEGNSCSCARLLPMEGGASLTKALRAKACAGVPHPTSIRSLSLTPHIVLGVKA